MPNTDPQLLIIDDEPQIGRFVAKAASARGFEVTALTDPDQFVDTLKSVSPSVIVMDLKMPGCDGIQLLDRVRQVGSTAQIIVMSGMDRRVLKTAEKLGQAHGLNMVGVLQKPIKLDDLNSFLDAIRNDNRQFSAEDLAAAITNRELTVHYQPKIVRDATGWSVNGAEALVRWRHPAFGVIMPGEFLPLAEEAGLIDRLTDCVLKDSCRQAAKWLRDGLDLQIAVNISAGLLDDLDLPGRIQVLLAEHELPGSCLILELTESAAMADLTNAMDIFLRLRVNDIGLAIDDFGTGFSSLQQLYLLPFDELKIDRSFVQPLPDDEAARAIVRATINMAHALDMRVCAEGVETRDALDYLASVDCDEAQGFFISRAVSASEFEKVIGPWGNEALKRAVR